MTDDHALAAKLASVAGAMLQATRASGLLEGKPLGQAGDAVAHEWLCRVLREQREDDGLLSEEGDPGAPDRQTRERVWIIDPLDGTREYSEGRSDWAVHVALTVGGQMEAAAVALPGLDQVFSTAEPVEPATGDGGGGPLRIAVSRTRPPEFAEKVAAAVGGELVGLGSAGYKTLAVVRGEVDAYMHGGGQWEWDVAAPAGVAMHAGLHVSRIDGSPLVFNRPEPKLPDQLICRPEDADRLLGAIADAS
ncbi:MAG TPA: 3'(2'),5'-bisphosphate nucleotidase CysQ [Thermoleophilaceae bacterium]|nr:3'(2'),5'-bisphosphate nucleotidase CysQ [Thermoleophilaceae bacterium]